MNRLRKLHIAVLLSAGLHGGANAIYVGGNPLGNIDPKGLAQIAEPASASFMQSAAWHKKYADLYRQNELMRERIQKYCPQLLGDFDRWIIFPDPRMDDMFKRARNTYATTNYSADGPSATQFNWAFFNTGPSDPPQSMIFGHEFRHTMKSNHDLGLPGSSFHSDAGIESDADQWSSSFWKERCECRK